MADSVNEETLDIQDIRQKALDQLNALGLNWTITEHEAVHTIEEMDRLGLPTGGAVCKNLFLRDYKGKKHYLLVLQKDKRADLKALAVLLGSTPLSFASPERLETYLGVKKGAVTPLGVVNDSSHAVQVYMDADLTEERLLGVHPNVNTATVWLRPADLETYVKACGNSFALIHI